MTVGIGKPGMNEIFIAEERRWKGGKYFEYVLQRDRGTKRSFSFFFRVVRRNSNFTPWDILCFNPFFPLFDPGTMAIGRALRRFFLSFSLPVRSVYYYYRFWSRFSP